MRIGSRDDRAHGGHQRRHRHRGANGEILRSIEQRIAIRELAGRQIDLWLAGVGFQATDADVADDTDDRADLVCECELLTKRIAVGEVLPHQ